MISLRKIQDIKSELKGVRVLCRIDLNVPIKTSGIVLSDFRIKAALPTIELLQNAGAKVILISHIGRKQEESLRSVANYMIQNLGVKMEFIPSIFGEEIETKIEEMKNGDIIMLENLRSDEGEKENHNLFTKELAEHGDIYVNDAFSVSHRNHASITGLSKELPAFAGLQLQKEIEHLSLNGKKHPFLFVLGGAKFETKAPLVKRFLDDADDIYIGGALAHDFYKAKGYEIGKSLHYKSVGEEMFQEDKIILPTDVLVENGARTNHKQASEVLHNDTIVDMGTDSLKDLKNLSSRARTILWNGPLGWYEKGYDKATREYVEFLAKSSAEVMVGGGDTVNLIEKIGLIDQFYFVSTGGGAMLEFLEKGTLVGLENLKES
jgi:phosphoglycerate kinase